MTTMAAPVPGAGGGATQQQAKRKEIYKYEAPWTVFSMNWSVRPDRRFRLALGSFVEEYNNKVQVVSLDEDTSEFTAKSTFDHPYPTTKIMWIPDSKVYHQSFVKIYKNTQLSHICQGIFNALKFDRVSILTSSPPVEII